MAVKDFILGDDGDLQIVNGEFLVAESDEQSIEHILISQPGMWKQSPLVGVGLEDYLNAPGGAQALNALRKNINLQLEMDGFNVINLAINDFDDIEINVERINA
jgi:hypothetical protein